jgi:hypothetical protein
MNNDLLRKVLLIFDEPSSKYIKAIKQVINKSYTSSKRRSVRLLILKRNLLEESNYMEYIDICKLSNDQTPEDLINTDVKVLKKRSVQKRYLNAIAGIVSYFHMGQSARIHYLSIKPSKNDKKYEDSQKLLKTHKKELKSLKKNKKNNKESNEDKIFELEKKVRELRKVGDYSQQNMMKTKCKDK